MLAQLSVLSAVFRDSGQLSRIPFSSVRRHSVRLR
eukprot:COSAG03_NODE_1556_length_3876_cov_228.651046_6_plen_35_part_00